MIYGELPGLVPKWLFSNFLVLGEWPDLWKPFIDANFKGTAVLPPSSPILPTEKEWMLNVVKVNVGIEPHFQKLLTGEWIKVTTVREVFDKWNGPYDVIAINVPMMTRKLWYSEQIQNALPQMYLLPEDGHNEFVLELARDRGYKQVALNPDVLVLIHQGQRP